MDSTPEGWPWYKCVEDERFRTEIEREFGGQRAWDDIRRLVEEDILRGPGEFPSFPGSRLHFAPLNTVPARIIIFEVDAINEIVRYKAVRRTGQG